MTNKQIDLAVFEELKQVSGADFIDELVDTFLQDAPQLMAQLSSSLKAGDVETFRRAAHSLKSNGATFGARQLSEQARELEMLAKSGQLQDVGNRLDGLKQTYAAAAAELKELRQ